MKRMSLASLGVLVFAGALQAQTIDEKIKSLQTTTAKLLMVQTEQSQQLNGISSVQARMQSDVMDLQAKIDKLEAKLDAVLKSQGVTMQSTSTPGWNGTTSFAVQPQSMAMPQQVALPSFMASSMYGDMGMGSGSCANGSCGSGASKGLFRRRR